MKHRRTILSAALAAVILLAAGCSQDDGTQSSRLVGPDNPQAIPGPRPPATPSGLFASSVTATGFELTWSANVETDLAGYRIYVYQPSPARENAYLLLNPDALIPTNHYCYAGSTVDGVWIKVSAVNTQDEESQLSEVLVVLFSQRTLPTTPASGVGDDPDQPATHAGGSNQPRGGGGHQGV